ncbi:MAG TPA: trigger factor [Lachnospiraceae bacterium]|jgi:trigger factor|nr:trigger factor [Butyrivibrio sp. CAG:318]HJI31927.1 trigger factor [Lachnospiraceae bacterium]
MSFTVENLEKNMAKLTIEVSAEDFEKALQKAYEKNKNKIAVNGFRKGKVPRAVIEKVYGAGVFYEDAANILIPEEYSKAAEESKLDIVSQPEIDVTQIEKGKSFIFTAEVALKPEVTLGEYLGVEIEKTDAKVTADDVKAELEKVREQNARLVDVTSRGVKDKDQAVIDFEGFVDGVPFEGGKGTDYPLTIGSHSFIDNFEEQLIGAKIGKEVEVNVTFPENYQAAELAGKPATFKVTVKAIKVKELPKLDDDFAKDVSEFDTLADYKADIKKNLTEKKKEEAKREKEAKAVAKAVENASMDIPEGMIKLQVNNMVNEFAQRLQMQGLSIDQYIQYMGSNHQQFMESLKPEAVTRIKNSLVLEAVVKAENITATEDDFEEEVKRMADMYKMEVDKVKEILGDNEKEQIMSDLAIQKAAELIASKAVEKAAPKAAAE